MHKPRSRDTEASTDAGRHGRGVRSSMYGPYLPNLNNRVSSFDRVAGGTIDYLRSLWPAELSSVQFDFVSIPTDPPELIAEEPEMWQIHAKQQRITFFRVPMQRAGHLLVDDDVHRRMFIEYNVYSAVAEYLGKEPWELLPPEEHDRF